MFPSWTRSHHKGMFLVAVLAVLAALLTIADLKPVHGSTLTATILSLRKSTSTHRLSAIEPLVQVTSDSSRDEMPAIMQATDGRLWVVWDSWRSGNGEIWYKT